MNIELLEKVKRIFLNDPNKLEMYVYRFGSKRCIAGLVLDLTSDEDKKKANINDVFGLEGQNAAKVLGITIEQSLKLFALVGWPREFYDKYYATKNATNRVDILSERIDYFIENGI